MRIIRLNKSIFNFRKKYISIKDFESEVRIVSDKSDKGVFTLILEEKDRGINEFYTFCVRPKNDILINIKGFDRFYIQKRNSFFIKEVVLEIN